ncbi:MAG: HupE/UreJ family protein, partial [Myxococcota bacterium]
TALGSFEIGSLHPAIPAGLCVFALCYFAILDRIERPVRLRFAISFVFGLVHGFGFAGVLEEIELPVDRLARALLGFNLGVEAGQLVVIAILWPTLRWLARIRGGRPHRWLLEFGTAAACGMGIFWLVQRAY